jgi:4-diphosphocytidyl-2-C-methyl-D-erythritol kinase
MMSISEANDLYASAISCYPYLKYYAKDGWYFSGSGSSFFRLKEK